jgi:hypothetical protein
MKSWMITILAVVGGYAVYSWLTNQRRMPAGNRLSAQAGVSLGKLGVAIGIQSNVDPTTSGVPTFNTSAIANGHGDQVIAAQHSNPYSTLPGAFLYEPAFGPNTNQMSSGELTPGLV